MKKIITQEIRKIKRYLKFYNLEDLRKQGAAYLKRSNNIPMAVLEYLTPREKRRELELQRI